MIVESLFIGVVVYVVFLSITIEFWLSVVPTLVAVGDVIWIIEGHMGNISTAVITDCFIHSKQMQLTPNWKLSLILNYFYYKFIYSHSEPQLIYIHHSQL